MEKAMLRYGNSRPLHHQKQIMDMFLQRKNVQDLFPNQVFSMTPEDCILASKIFETLKDSLQHGVHRSGGGQLRGVKIARETTLSMMIGKSSLTLSLVDYKIVS